MEGAKKESSIEMTHGLKRYASLLHEMQFRDKVKSAEYHYAVSFEFDGFFEGNLPKVLFDKMVFLSKEIEFSSFKIGASWPLNLSDAEKSHLRASIQTPLIKRVEGELGKKIEAVRPDVEFLIDFRQKLVLIRVYPVYIFGKYCKYSREIAQTEYFCNKCRGEGCWYCKNTGHFCEESVEQLLGKVIAPKFGAKLLVLHGAGREDMDVLMLGKGRPFIAELLLPTGRSFDLESLEGEINLGLKEKVSVNSLRFAKPEEVSIVKDSLHYKIYSAYVTADKSVDLSKLKGLGVIKVLQATPTRVEKRRASLDRAKEVEILGVDSVAEREFVLTLRTSHGAYVKEFISGDNGKTNPSISSILNAACFCALLDVAEVCD